MKKVRVRERSQDLLKEYDFSRAVRGKYTKRYARGSNVVVLAPDVAELFPDSRAVNDALRVLARLSPKHRRRTARSATG